MTVNPDQLFTYTRPRNAWASAPVTFSAWSAPSSSAMCSTRSAAGASRFRRGRAARISVLEELAMDRLQVCAIMSGHPERRETRGVR